MRDHSLSLTSIIEGGLQCLNQGCNKNFIRFSSLVRHIKNVHIVNNRLAAEETYENMIEIEEEEEREENILENPTELEETNQYADNILIDPADQEQKRRTIDIEASACRMIAILRACPSFTGTSLDRVSEAADDFLWNSLKHLHNEATSFLQTKKIDSQDADAKEFLSCFEFTAPFKEMKEFDGHIESLKTYYNYVEPEEIYIGKRTEQRFNQKTQQFEPNDVIESFQYVPEIETLKLALSHSQIRDYINNERCSSEEKLKNFTDGLAYKKNKLFQ